MDHVERSRLAFGRSADRYASTIGSTMSNRVETDADLELLDRFAVDIRRLGGLAIDVGCGTGRVAHRLDEHGVDVIGFDVADGMVAIAQREHRSIGFGVAELLRLPVASGRCASAVYWYSIITTPPAELPSVFAEASRVLSPSGRCLVAFHVGEGTTVARPDAYGTGVDLTLHRHAVDTVTTALEAGGFDVDEVTVRPPQLDHEATDQAFIIASSTRS